MIDFFRTSRKRLKQWRSDQQPVLETNHRSHHQEYIIMGLGRFGSSLAMALHKQGQDVLAIDVDERLVQRYANSLPHVVHMDITNRDGLLELGAGNFDTGIVCVGSDFESNVMATVLLRELGTRRVICKAYTRTQRDILLKVGADEVILPEHEAGVRLARKLASRGFVDFMEVTPDISVVELTTPPHLVGKSLLESNIRQKYGIVVVAIRRADGVIIVTSPEEVLRPDDILVVIGKPHDCEDFLEH